MTTLWEMLWATDPELLEAILADVDRQKLKMNLIASENYTTPAEVAVLDSTVRNKHTEG